MSRPHITASTCLTNEHGIRLMQEQGGGVPLPLSLSCALLSLPLRAPSRPNQSALRRRQVLGRCRQTDVCGWQAPHCTGVKDSLHPNYASKCFNFCVSILIATFLLLSPCGIGGTRGCYLPEIHISILQSFIFMPLLFSLFFFSPSLSHRDNVWFLFLCWRPASLELCSERGNIRHVHVERTGRA